MAPKRWARSLTTRPDNPVTALSSFVHQEIESDNGLGLLDEEIKGMGSELINAKTRAEVFEWCKTLMMGEDFAAEIIKRREDFGPPFEGESVRSAAGSAATAPGRSNKGKMAGHMKVSKKGKRGVNINKLSSEKQSSTALKPGQFECGCFATIHKYRSNCANCGRIFCEQESDASCYYCEMDPSRCIMYEIAVQDGKLTAAALEENKERYEEAIARRDKLLDYAEQRSKRTTVIDDQAATLFSPQSAWLSPKEREETAKAVAQEEQRRKIESMHRYKGAYQVHLDFVNQNVSLGAVNTAPEQQEPEEGAQADAANSAASSSSVEEDHDWSGDEVIDARAEPLPTLVQKIWYSPDEGRAEEASSAAPDGAAAGTTEASHPARPPLRRHEELSKRVQQDYFKDDVELFAEEAHEKMCSEVIFSPKKLNDVGDGEGSGEEEDAAADSPLALAANRGNSALPAHFAPSAIMRSRDDGICLSMHQPWASLLVAGIKTHEGRVWGTDYRGRLWIHAAAAEAVDTAAVEAQYSQFMSPGQTFPRYYPTRVLLGYVYLTGCLDREEYEKTFEPKDRQEESPFSFICAEPKALALPLPMSGNHKLFSLEHKVKMAAKRQLGEIS